MNLSIYRITLILTIIYPLYAGATGNVIYNDFVFKSNNQTVVFMSAESGYNYLIKSDLFDKWNDYFDASIRLKKDLSAYTKSENLITYKTFLKEQCLYWEEGEIQNISQIIQDVQVNIIKYSKQVLQDSLFMIKTSGKEEFRAFYTNQKAIIIPKSQLRFLKIKSIKRQMEETLVHEFFHIYSRYNVEKREELYSMIGFERADKFAIPDELEQSRITNPDFYDLNYTVALEDTAKGIPRNYVMLLISKYPKYAGVKNFIGIFSTLLGYLEVQFHYVDENGTVELTKTKIGNEIYKKTGTLSGYSLGVDEILAEAFRVLITTSPESKGQLSNRDKEILQNMHTIIE
ncbi:MAG: hypothetical protein ACK505_07225 [Flavobacteriales bacterium]|jgi:hypothetical protein